MPAFKKLLFSLLFIPCLVGAEQTKTVYSPFTGKLDFITALSTNSIKAGSNVTVTTTSSGVQIDAGSSGSMTPGVSYYVQVDPPSVQAGAFNISSGTIENGPLTVWKAGLGSMTYNPNGSSDSLIFDSNAIPSLSWGITKKYLGANIFQLSVVPTGGSEQNFDIYLASSTSASAQFNSRYRIGRIKGKHIFSGVDGTTLVEFDPVNNSSFTIPTWASSGTFNTALNLPYATQGNCLQLDTSGKVVSAAAPCGSGGGGGSYVFAVSSNGVVISTPAYNLSFNNDLLVTVTGSTNIVTTDKNILLTALAGATTYASQSDVNKSTTSTSLTFANYYSTGATQNLFNLKTVDATTYALQSVVLQSTNQITFQFANYATTQTTTNISNTFNNYNSTGANNALFLKTTVAATTYMPLGTPGIVTVATGSVMGFNGTISSSAATVLLFSTAGFMLSGNGGTTDYIQLNGTINSTHTINGQITFNSTVTFNSGFQMNNQSTFTIGQVPNAALSQAHLKISSSAATANNAGSDGEIFNSGTNNQLFVTNYGLMKGVQSTIAFSTSAYIYGNSVAGTTVPVANLQMSSITVLTSNYFTLGKRWHAYSVCRTSTTAQPNLFVGFNIGTTTIINTQAMTMPTGLANADMIIDFHFVVTSTGAAGTLAVWGDVQVASSTTGSYQRMFTSITPSVTLDTTNNYANVGLWEQWGTAAAGNTVQTIDYLIEEK